MAKHNCPACGHTFETGTTKKTKLETKIVNEVIYYARMTNYTTGLQKTWATFPADNKPKPKHIRNLIAARARGEICPGGDWFKIYSSYIPKR